MLPLIPLFAMLLCMRIEQSAANGRIHNTISEMPKYRAALVLGAGIHRNGKLSWTLRNRVNKAIELYNSGRVDKLLMSGDNRFATYNEPEAMALYAIRNGVPAEDVVPDYAGRRTWDSVYRAKHIFDLDKLVIVTQDYHLPRALFLAREVGIDAYGMEAPRGSDGRAPVREYLASVSAVLDAFILRPEPILGKKEPLVGTLTLEKE